MLTRPSKRRRLAAAFSSAFISQYCKGRNHGREYQDIQRHTPSKNEVVDRK